MINPRFKLRVLIKSCLMVLLAFVLPLIVREAYGFTGVDRFHLEVGFSSSLAGAVVLYRGLKEFRQTELGVPIIVVIAMVWLMFQFALFAADLAPGRLNSEY